MSNSKSQLSHIMTKEESQTGIKGKIFLTVKTNVKMKPYVNIESIFAGYLEVAGKKLLIHSKRQKFSSSFIACSQRHCNFVKLLEEKR